MTEHELYYDPDDISDSPVNAGIGENGIERTVRRVSEAGAEYRVVDASELTRAEAEDAYQRLAVPPSVRRRYRVRGVFGTNKYSGGFFGKGVPALVVLENGRPKDIYPHQEQDGTIVTINDYLDRLDNGGTALAARMDALRERIGKIGATARELIDDGRRL